MIRSASTTRKQLEEVRADRNGNETTLSLEDRILTLLDERIESAINDTINGANPESVEVEFSHEGISLATASRVKRLLQEKGYKDVQIFSEMSESLREKVCVRIVVNFDWLY